MQARDAPAPGAGATGSCELPDAGTGNPSRGLYKSGKCFSCWAVSPESLSLSILNKGELLWGDFSLSLMLFLVRMVHGLGDAIGYDNSAFATLPNVLVKQQTLLNPESSLLCPLLAGWRLEGFSFRRHVDLSKEQLTSQIWWKEQEQYWSEWRLKTQSFRIEFQKNGRYFLLPCWQRSEGAALYKQGQGLRKQPMLGYRDGWELLSLQRITDGGLDETSPKVSAFDYLLPSWLCCRSRFRKGALEGEPREFKDSHHFEFALLPAWSWNLNCHFIYRAGYSKHNPSVSSSCPHAAAWCQVSLPCQTHSSWTVIPNKQFLLKVSLVVVFSLSNWKAHHATPMSQELRWYSVL